MYYEYNESITAWLPRTSLSLSLTPIASLFLYLCRPPSKSALNVAWSGAFLEGSFFALRLCQLQLKSSKSNPVNRLLPGQQLNHRPYRILSSWTIPDQTEPNRTVPMIISAISAWVQLLQRLCCWRMMSLKHSTLTLTFTFALTHIHTHTASRTCSLLDRMSPGNSSWLSIIR